VPTRRAARERALGLAYECEQRGVAASELLAELPVPPDEYARMLVVGVDDPTDTAVVEDLQLLLGIRVEMVTSTTVKIQRAITRLYGEAARDNGDPCLYQNVLIGIIRDQEVADAAAKALGVRILPPYWQSR